MPADHWFTGSDRAPGKELFRTDRTVRVWLQTVSHSQLLLRAIDGDSPTRLDLLFTGVDQQCLHMSYDGLVVRCPTDEEAAGPASGTTFVLESGAVRDHVSAEGFGWREEEQTDFGPDALPARMMPLPFEPPWPAGGPVVAGYRPSGPVIPLGGLTDALSTDEPAAARNRGFRHVHAVVVRTTRSLPDGREDRMVAPVAVYLTREQAEEAIRAETAETAAVVARGGQPDAVVQDRLVAGSLAATSIERWVVTLPVQL